MVHPNVPQSPIPQMQVIQQPLHGQTYLPHMFGTQQPVLMPGNITMSPSIQVITAATGKACVPNQITTQMLTAAGKQVIQGRPNYLPSGTNQTLVIGQLGMLPSQSSLVNAHNNKQVADHKVRPYVMNASSLQSKSPNILPQQSHPGGVGGAGGALNSSQFKQLSSQATIVSTPQLITSQAPGTMIASQSQLINGLQAISTTLPHGLTWATQHGLQSHVIAAQNPIFIHSSQQQDMYIQQQQQPTPIQPQPQQGIQPISIQHQQQAQMMKTKQMELAPNIQLKQGMSMVGGNKFTTILPNLVPPIRPASSVATQTNTLANLRPQLKQRAKGHLNRVAPAPTTMASAITGTVQYHKADAANQTKIFIAPQQQPIPIQSKMATTHVIGQQQLGVYTDVMGIRMATANVMPMPISSPNPSGMMEAMDTSETIGHETNHMNQQMINVSSSSAAISISTTSVKEVGQQTSSSPNFNANGSSINTNDSTQMLQQLLQPSNPTVTLPEVHEVAVGTDNGGNKEKQQPQKAIVKPHVLTHVIEGYVIQEAGEPFPVVSRSNINNEITSPKQNVTAHMINESTINTNTGIVSTVSCPSPSVQSSKVRASPQPLEQHTEPTESWPAERVSPLELAMAKCEECGKLDYVARFKRSKRFCSSSCSKRYAHKMAAAGSSSSYAQGDDGLDYSSSLKHSFSSHHKMRKYKSHSDGGKYGKKKKHGPKMKKSMRKLERSRLVYNDDEWVRTQNPIESAKEEETNSSNSGAESSLSPITPTNPKDMMELESAPRKSPKKWSVQEVFEFIKSLPGCADYAEDFRMQEIDGHALLLLKEDHLMTAMNMKLGPALKICAKITSLKEEMQRQ
ncbi:hypothetical protein CHUAL_001490 [Chamberlinius hualienensis]